MRFADAHSDLGVLIHQVGIGLVQRDVLEQYFSQMKQGVVSLAIVQIGGDFGQENLDYREYGTVSRSMNEVRTELSVNQPDFKIITKGSDLEATTMNHKNAFIH